MQRARPSDTMRRFQGGGTKVARRVTTQSGHNRLEEAIAILLQTQAAFLARLAESDKRLADNEREASERFARIERDLTAILGVLSEHSRVLSEQSRLLERLPEAVRDKIGFRGQA
jgi:hypothetical protein